MEEIGDVMHEYRIKVIRVVDGDTVDVDIDLGFGTWLFKQRVRLYGIDTPESRTRDKVEKMYGMAAKAYVQDHLKKAKSLRLRTHKDAKGKFGRILGEFILDNDGELVNLNKLMIQEHHAVPYKGQSKEAIEEGHLKNRELVQHPFIIK